MTQTTCPSCDCTWLEYLENYGYWECLDCGHVWAVDEDDPDYAEVSDDINVCSVCKGAGLIQSDYELYELLSCPECGGSGMS